MQNALGVRRFLFHTSSRGRRFALALLGSAALASAASRADGAGSLALSVGSTSAALGAAKVALTCATVGSSGRRISAPSLAPLDIAARDALADAALGYLAGTSVPYPAAVLRADVATFTLGEVALDDVGRGARAVDFRFTLRARLANASVPFALDTAPAASNATLATSTPAPTDSPEPTAATSAAARAKATPRALAHTLSIEGVGVFPMAAASASSAAELGTVRIDGAVAERLIPSCIAGRRARNIVLVSSLGRSSFASARIATLEQHYDRSGLRVSIVRFADVEKVAPSPQASATP